MADLWLVGEMVNRIGIYGSKVAEGLSAFQRRSCLKLGIYHGVYFDCIKIMNIRGYIDLLDTSVIVFVNNLLWFVFHFMLFA